MKRIWVFFLFIWLHWSVAIADEQGVDWSISGFGTAGIIGSDSRQLGFIRDRSQWQDVTNTWNMTTDTRLGLQLDVNFNENFHFTTQWIARDHGGDFFEQNLDWFFLKWSPLPDFEMRFGRMGSDLFLLSDYRNLGYAYPWMRPPQEFYANVPLFHFDGIDATKKFSIDDGVLSLKVFGGNTFNQFPSQFGGGETIDTFGRTFGGNIVYEKEPWLYRFGYAYIHLLEDSGTKAILEGLHNPFLNIAIPNLSKFADEMIPRGLNAHFLSLGASYDDSVWVSHAEVAFLEVPQGPVITDDFSAYLSLGRRFDNVTMYAMYGVNHSLKLNWPIPQPLINTPQIQAISRGIDLVLNHNGIDQQSLSIGLRWDFHSKVALKAQWSHYWFGENGTRLWNETTLGGPTEQVNVWSMGFDFIF